MPSHFRRALGLREGDDVILLLEDGEIRIITPRQALLRAQQLVRRHVAGTRSLATELLRERREEQRRG